MAGWNTCCWASSNDRAVEAGPIAQPELHEQLGAHVAQVLDGLVEPALGGAPAGRRGTDDDPVATAAGGVPAPGDQAPVDQAVDGAVRERAAQRPDPPQLAVGCEDGPDRPPVGEPLDDEHQADGIGEGQLPVVALATRRRGRADGYGGCHVGTVARPHDERQLLFINTSGAEYSRRHGATPPAGRLDRRGIDAGCGLRGRRRVDGRQGTFGGGGRDHRFAAASLTDAFTEIGTAFTAANPDATATFSFDASSALVTQITEGAPADVFASADVTNMDKLVEAGLNGTAPEVFATNLLAIIVAPDNPLGITGVADLADADIKTAICAAEVPCGRYAAEIFANAGVTVTPVTLEQNVRGVVTKVTAGEADAGIVYVTDVLAAGDQAELVEIPEDINVLAEYPIATVSESANPEVAEAFVDFVPSPEAQELLGEFGFDAP